MVWGLPPSLVMICRTPEREPWTVGENVTFTVQELFPAIADEQVLVCAKSPETLTAQMVDAVDVVFVMVEESAELVEPTV